MKMGDHVSSTCATHGTQVQGLGGAVRMETAQALQPGRMEMGRMEGALGIRIARTLDLVFASRKCKFSASKEALFFLLFIKSN